MKVMILAAGRGKRMLPLTQTLPKPLVKVKNTPLIVHHLQRLAKLGFSEVVVNISVHAKQIMETLGDGSDLGLKISFSYEKEPLEAGGGIRQALPLLGHDPFMVISSDLYTDFPFQKLKEIRDSKNNLAHLILVPNPDHHEQGDFSFANGMNARDGNDGNEILSLNGSTRYTFAGIAVFHPQLFQNTQPGSFPLKTVLVPAIEKEQISGELYHGLWHNVGTVEMLRKLNEEMG